MKLTSDYHTHTVYSDGKNSVMENAVRAKEMGLCEIGATEHGFSHLAFGIRRWEMPRFIEECKEAEKATGVKVLVGMETNLRGESGLTDYKVSDYPMFDLFLCGIHVFIRFEHYIEAWRFGFGSMLKANMNIRPSKSLVRRTTNAYVNAVKKNPIDVLTHVNYLCFSDPVEVAKACRDYGTYFELSSKKNHLSDDELYEVAKTGVRFVVNSDAHTFDRIGDYKLAEEQIERVGVPHSLIDNIDGKMPTFRFAEYKKRNL